MFKAPVAYAQDNAAARAYLLTRCSDAEALVAQGITKLPYVFVMGTAEGIWVGHVLCGSSLCALAYILATWW